MKSKSMVLITLLLLAATLLFAPGCLNRAANSTGGAVVTTASGSDVNIPHPKVESVSAATSGMLDKYYAILDVTVKNDGADGTVIVKGIITQGSLTSENSMPAYITHGDKQTVRLVFPLKWMGGDWTPDVQVQIP